MASGPLTRANLSNTDESVLRLYSGTAFQPAPKTEPRQEGFSNALISVDGKTAGWLALITTDCCQSYPLPLTLVIYRDNKTLRRFTEDEAIWSWSFESHGTAVAYRTGTTHGNSMVTYRLRRISDGKLLGHYQCFSADPTLADGSSMARVPSWVWPIADDCPERNGKEP